MSEHTAGNRVQVQHFLGALEDDPKKLARAQDLLEMQEELSRARKVDAGFVEMVQIGSNAGQKR